MKVVETLKHGNRFNSVLLDVIHANRAGKQISLVNWPQSLTGSQIHLWRDIPGCGQCDLKEDLSEVLSRRSQTHYWTRFLGLDTPTEGALWVQNKLSSIDRRYRLLHVISACASVWRNTPIRTSWHECSYYRSTIKHGRNVDYYLYKYMMEKLQRKWKLEMLPWQITQ